MNKHHFDAFQNEKHFQKQPQPYSQKGADSCQFRIHISNQFEIKSNFIFWILGVNSLQISNFRPFGSRLVQGPFFGSKGVCYVHQLKVLVILGQFLVLSVFLLSLLSLAFVLSSNKKKCKGSSTIRISCILTRYYGTRRD